MGRNYVLALVATNIVWAFWTGYVGITAMLPLFWLGLVLIFAVIYGYFSWSQRRKALPAKPLPLTQNEHADWRRDVAKAKAMVEAGTLSLENFEGYVGALLKDKTPVGSCLCTQWPEGQKLWRALREHRWNLESAHPELWIELGESAMPAAWFASQAREHASVESIGAFTDIVMKAKRHVQERRARMAELATQAKEEAHWEAMAYTRTPRQVYASLSATMYAGFTRTLYGSRSRLDEWPAAPPVQHIHIEHADVVNIVGSGDVPKATIKEVDVWREPKPVGSPNWSAWAVEKGFSVETIEQWESAYAHNPHAAELR